MGRDAELRAFDALGKNTRLSDLVAVARAVVFGAAEARRADWADAAKVEKLSAEASLSHDSAMTPFGDALKVLERGPEDDAERALACALAAHVIAEAPPKGRDAEDRAASDLLWLAAHTPFDATGLLDRALGDAAAELWDAVADRVRRIDAGALPPFARGEAVVGAVALAASSSPAAAKHVSSLAADVRDAKLAFVMSRPAAGGGDAERIEGELASWPRDPVETAILAVTGILLVIHLVRLVGRLALAYKRPAEVTLSEESVRIKTRTELLGRTLRDREVVIPRAGLARATREVRYPRAAFYAGLFALAVGSYIGVAWIVDGVRSSSISMIFVGLLVVIAGVGIDFVLGSLAPSAAGRCRVLFVPKAGQWLCVSGVDAKRADAALARLAPR
jgi:hypothetical protein